MSADDAIAAQLLGNGGKIEPYTIIIMGSAAVPISEETENLLANCRP
jgi:hypothetical protein